MQESMARCGTTSPKEKMSITYQHHNLLRFLGQVRFNEPQATGTRPSHGTGFTRPTSLEEPHDHDNKTNEYYWFGRY